MLVTLYFDLYPADPAGPPDQPAGAQHTVRAGRPDSTSWGVHRPAGRRPARTTR